MSRFAFKASTMLEGRREQRSLVDLTSGSLVAAASNLPEIIKITGSGTVSGNDNVITGDEEVAEITHVGQSSSGGTAVTAGSEQTIGTADLVGAATGGGVTIAIAGTKIYKLDSGSLVLVKEISDNLRWIATDGTYWIICSTSEVYSSSNPTGTGTTESTGWQDRGVSIGGPVATDGTIFTLVSSAGLNKTIFTATPSNFGSWSSAQSIASNFEYLTYNDSYWVLSVSDSNSSDGSYWATDPTSSTGWTLIDPLNGNYNYQVGYNGTIWATASRFGRIYYADDPTPNVWTRGNDASTGSQHKALSANDTVWIIGNNNGGLYFTTSLISSSTWTQIGSNFSGEWRYIDKISSTEFLCLGDDGKYVILTTIPASLDSITYTFDPSQASSPLVYANIPANTTAAQYAVLENTFFANHITAATLTGLTLSSITNGNKLTATSAEEITDLEVENTGGGGSTLVSTVFISTQGEEGSNGIRDTLTITADVNSHSPFSYSVSIPSAITLSAVMAILRAIFTSEEIGGYTLETIDSTSFSITSDTPGAEDTLIVTYTQGSGSDIVITRTVTREGGIDTLDITATLSGGGLTSAVTVGPASEITAAQLNSALDTAVASDSAVTIANESEGRVLTGTVKIQHPAIALSVDLTYTDNLVRDIRTLLFGN